MLINIVTFIHLMIVSLWVGAMIFFTFCSAPSIFKILPRESAGDVIGDIFPKYWILGYAAGAVSVATLFYMGNLLGRLSELKALVLIEMFALALFSGLVIGRRARAIKADMRAAEGEEQEAFRGKFRKIHAVSAIFNLSLILLGVYYIYLLSSGLDL